MMIKKIEIPDEVIKESIEKWNIKFRTIDDAIDWWNSIGKMPCTICYYVRCKRRAYCNDCIVYDGDEEVTCCAEFFQVSHALYGNMLNVKTWLKDVNKAIVNMRNKLKVLLKNKG